MKLLKVDTISEVQQKLQEYFGHMEREVEAVDLRNACGRYLAEDVEADVDTPSFRRSVVDGYALRGADTFGVSDSIPVFLSVVGTVEMGEPTTIFVESGQAVYVPTGGMIPDGADTMIMVEHVDQLGETEISVNRPSPPNANIMNIGDDFKKGQKFFSRGHRIGTKDIGLLAACGKASVSVFRRPKLAILSTGDELVDPSVFPGPCQIRDINAYAVAAFGESAGAEILSLSVVKDEPDAYKAAVEAALKESDLVILSGGSSAGTKDFTASIIDSLGSPGVITHGLAIKPGKPTIIGILTGETRNKAVIGLPGHPLSSIIVFDVIVNGFLKKYFLGNEERPKRIPAILGENIHSGEGRETYQLVNLEASEQDKATGRPGWTARPIRAKSGAISQLALADGYVVIPEGTEGVAAGQLVQVVPIQ